MNRFLIIPRLQIHNANALSSPYTIGFPAMTAWLGGVHALQRKLNGGQFDELVFTRAAVACHSIDLQTHKGRGDYVHSIIGTGNPLDKNGERPSFIEEARCHLTVSLVIEYQGVDADDYDTFLAAIETQLNTLKLAGGDILGFNKPELLKVGANADLAKLTRKLMPSYVLKERRDLMIEAMQNQGDNIDAIDALLDYLTVQHRSEADEANAVELSSEEPSPKGEGWVRGNQKADKVRQTEWTAKRKTAGWIVPIATGFHGISALGKAENQRDPDTPHRFAESLVTLGEFVMPYRIKRLDDLLWHSRYDAENNLYLIEQNNRKEK
ncbi:type I-F CRISPR-associated protein Csy2 [Methylobacter sp.]|uniref:type I-F CRISPR-associated protein Csy2 n=1 Tax=Methylobacter sp. TaxID=2051955 RepID=UPI002FDE6400